MSNQLYDQLLLIPSPLAEDLDEKIALGAKFRLLEDQPRFHLLDDLFEFDRCRFQNKHSLTLPLESGDQKGAFSRLFDRIFGSDDIELWAGIEERILSKTHDARDTSLQIEVNMRGSRVPREFRASIWKYFIGNRIRFNKSLFNHLLKAIASSKPNPAIERDGLKIFHHFSKSPEFRLVLKEAAVLIEIFQLYRPDVNYVPGMICPTVILLLVLPPYQAFKALANLIVGSKVFFNCYSLESKKANPFYARIRLIAHQQCPQLSKIIQGSKIDLWGAIWSEMVYFTFQSTFDLRTTLVLWDFMLMNPNHFFLKFNYVAFRQFEFHLGQLDKDDLIRSCKVWMVRNSELLVRELVNFSDHEFDFGFLNGDEEDD